jgi:hypothetical protein
MQLFIAHRRRLVIFGCLCLMLSASMLVMGCEVPVFLTDIEAIIPVATSAIAGILALIGGLTGNVEFAAIAAALNAIATKIDAGLAQVNILIEQYKKSPNDTLLANIESGLNEVVGDLKTLLTTEGVPASIAGPVQAVAQALLTQIEALLSVLPVLKDSTAGQPVPNVVKPVSASAFKANIASALSYKP